MEQQKGMGHNEILGFSCQLKKSIHDLHQEHEIWVMIFIIFFSDGDFNKTNRNLFFKFIMRIHLLST